MLDIAYYFRFNHFWIRMSTESLFSIFDRCAWQRFVLRYIENDSKLIQVIFFDQNLRLKSIDQSIVYSIKTLFTEN